MSPARDIAPGSFDRQFIYLRPCSAAAQF